MSRILVTGGSGFIGSALVKALVAAGNRVRVLDDNSRGSPRRLAGVAKDIDFVAGDVRDAQADYMRGFELFHARRPETAITHIGVDDPSDAQYPDGRIAPVSRLAKRFLDAVEKGASAQPDFAAGFRVQQLIDAAQRSHREGKMIATAPAEMPA